MLEREGPVMTPTRVTTSPGQIEAVFQVDDPMGPWTLSVRRLQVGAEVIQNLGPVRFEPDLALTLWVFP